MIEYWAPYSEIRAGEVLLKLHFVSFTDGVSSFLSGNGVVFLTRRSRSCFLQLRGLQDLLLAGNDKD